jgi:putative Mg2+ transporter-C (MgtC) family protein
MEEIMDFDIYLRVLAALGLGVAIGLEREISHKYAGLRTNILVCLGACMFTVISIEGFPLIMGGGNVMGGVDPSFTPGAVRDTARVAAQIVTGIGFIGGGTVLRHGTSVHGLTTAATLWMAAAIGMACGAGMYVFAAFSTLIAIVVLVSARLFEFERRSKLKDD